MKSHHYVRSGQEKLSPAFNPFLAMASCFTLASLVYNTFITTFVLRATGSSESVMVFQIILAFCQPFAMIFAVYLIRRVSAIRSQQVGLAILTCMSIYVFVTVEDSIAHIYWIAALQSVANGFYFTTYACQFVSYTNDATRDKAAGLLSFFANLLSLGFSAGSMLVFKVFPGYPGYRLLFLFAAAVYILAFGVSLKLYPLTTVSSDPTIYYHHAAQILWRHPCARSCMIIALLEGVRVGIMAFLPSVLLYSIIQDETLIAMSTTIAIFAGILAYAAYTRIVRIHNRIIFIRISILLTVTATLLMFFRLNAGMLLLYSGLSAFLLPFCVTPISNTYWIVLEKLPELEKCRPEAHGVREYYYTCGRILGIVFVMILPRTNSWSILVLAASVGIQYFGLYLSKKVFKNL